MEPTQNQFKGSDRASLESSALDQSINEITTNRMLTNAQKHERDVTSGVQGARDAVNLNVTVKEAQEHPDTLGGPVSGSALAKLKAAKSRAKSTKDREDKRR